MNVSEYVYYSEDSPTFLRWKVDIFCGRGRLQINRGSSAGSFKKRPDGKPHQVIVRIKKTDIAVHRVIWQLFNGEIPEGKEIDHIDRNPWNNIKTNLECKTHAHNMQNRKLSKNNKSGTCGVIITVSNGNQTGYGACWNENGKTKIKYFPFSVYGENAEGLAISYRKEKISTLNIKGESYTNNHGEP